MEKILGSATIILDALIEILTAEPEVKKVKEAKSKKTLKGNAFFYPRQIFQ